MKTPRKGLLPYPIALRQAIVQFLPARGLPLMGHCRWTDRLLVMVMVLLTFSTQTTLKDRFAEARGAVVAMYASRKRPGKTCEGFMAVITRRAKRLLAVVCPQLRMQTRQLAGRQWRIGQWLAFGVDGTRVNCPRTRDNQKRLKIGGRRKSAPQMLVVCLMHLGTGLLWNWRKSHARGSETALLRDMLEELPPGVLLLADAGFCGYHVLKDILSRGHDVLVRAGANRKLLTKLGYAVREHKDIVYVWPQVHAQGRGIVEPLILRRIVVRGRKGQRMCLLTSVLDPKALPVREALQLYAYRWGVEVLYRGFKQTFSKRTMLCDCAGHAQVELDFALVGFWLLNLLKWQAAGHHHPVTQGLAQTLRVVRQALQGPRHGRRCLTAQLRAIRPDTYHRPRSKTARNWAHKKHDRPCGIPEFRIATHAQIQRAKQLKEQMVLT